MAETSLAAKVRVKGVAQKGDNRETRRKAFSSKPTRRHSDSALTEGKLLRPTKSNMNRPKRSPPTGKGKSTHVPTEDLPTEENSVTQDDLPPPEEEEEGNKSKTHKRSKKKRRLRTEESRRNRPKRGREEELYSASDVTSETGSDGLDVFTPEDLALCAPEIIDEECRPRNRPKRGLDTTEDEGKGMRCPTEKEEAAVVLAVEDDETTATRRKSKARPAAKQDQVHRDKRQRPRQRARARARQIEEDVITTEEDMAPPENAVAKESLPLKKKKKSGMHAMRCCAIHVPVLTVDDLIDDLIVAWIISPLRCTRYIAQ